MTGEALVACDKATAKIVEESKVLHSRHLDLVMDRVHVCERAGIGLEHLSKGMKNFCNKDDRAFVKHYPEFRANDDWKGYLICSTEQSKALTRCKGMAGAFVRNYINVTVTDVDSLADNYYPDMKVIFVPNFAPGGDSLLKWKQDQIHKTLYARMMRNLITCVVVSDMQTLKQQMGVSVYNFVTTFFRGAE